MHVDERPVRLVPVGEHEHSEVSHRPQGCFDGVIGARAGRRGAGSLPVQQQRRGEGPDGRTQGLGAGVDAALSSSGGQPFRVIGRRRQAPLGEEILQPAGQRPDGPRRPAGAFQHGRRVVRMLVGQQPGQAADHRRGPARAMPDGEIGDEVPQPPRWVVQRGDQTLPAGHRPIRVLLPARPAHSQPGVSSQLTADLADPWRILRRTGSGT